MTHADEVVRELARLDLVNGPKPEKCPTCGATLEESRGYVGEDVLVCTKGCGVVWEDSEDAIRRVY